MATKHEIKKLVSPAEDMTAAGRKENLHQTIVTRDGVELGHRSDSKESPIVFKLG